MSATVLNDRQWRALWMLYTAPYSRVSRRELTRAIGKYAANTVHSLESAGLVQLVSGCLYVELTPAGSARMQSVFPAGARKFA